MKKTICIVLSFITMMSILTGCARSVSVDFSKINNDVSKSNSKFAFDIFSKLNQEEMDKNIFISPFSISTALTMTLQGAKTTTKDDMMNALKYDDIELVEVNENYKNLLAYLGKVDKKVELDISNSIWARKGKEVNNGFLNINKDVFNAYVSELDFSKADAVDKINKWIADSTKNKIPEMVKPPIPDITSMYLINAIYFKGEWTKKFDKQHTSNEKFYSGDGDIEEVTMMKRGGEIEYGAGDDFKAVRLPYGKDKISMYCILPEKNITINDFVNNLTEDKWEEIKRSIHVEEDVKLNIPKFKMEYGVKDLNKSLSSMGMEEAFSGKADFSGINDDGLYISRVLHKAVIEVNEEGSEAAGVTVVEMAETAVPSKKQKQPLSFIADRPFLFFITEDTTGTILFMGKLFDV